MTDNTINWKSSATFQGSKIFEGKNFTLKDFNGEDLSEAVFQNVNLTGANLSGCDLTDALFADCNLFEANLAGAILSAANFDNCNLHKADLTKVSAERVVTFNDCDMEDARFIRAQMPGAVVRDCNLKGANFTRAYLSRGVISHSNLSGAKLEYARIEEAKLYCLDLQKASFRGVEAKCARIEQCNLAHADLTGCDLTESLVCDVNFQDATLINVDFIDAELTRINYNGAISPNSKFPVRYGESEGAKGFALIGQPISINGLDGYGTGIVIYPAKIWTPAPETLYIEIQGYLFTWEEWEKLSENNFPDLILNTHFWNNWKHYFAIIRSCQAALKPPVITLEA